MSQKIKVYQTFSVFFLSVVISTLLFFMVATIRPLEVRAKNLESSTLYSNKPEEMTILSSSSLPFIQASSMVTLYFPIIFKSPRVVYLDTFLDKNSGWPKGDDGKCNSLYESGRYRLNVKADNECFRFAPASAERTYGWFEVTAYHSEGASNSSYGLYSNGSGAKNYYLFRIWPNNGCSQGGTWEFIRNKNDNLTTLRSGACNLSIRRGYGAANFNILKVKHASGGQITLYINGIQIDTFNDTANELTGRGTGVYARAASNKDIVIKYDDFTVFASE